ncbi:MAG: hypothetical protein P8Y68_16920 [Anaerolineales bacterium]
MKETELITQVNPEPIIAKIPYGKYVLPVLVFLVTGVVGLVIAYLIVGDNWLYAAVVLSIIPALLILHQNPLRWNLDLASAYAIFAAYSDCCQPTGILVGASNSSNSFVRISISFVSLWNE